MLIDEVKIKLMGGKGGDGCVAFDRSKFSQGPDGGNGGCGGDVYFEGISNLNALNKFRFKKEFAAGDGKRGRPKKLDGAKGEDLVLQVPIGTVAHNSTNGKDSEITKVGQKVLALKGGKGGKGNYFFRSSTNITPEEFEYGRPGQQFDFLLELRLIADIGLIGFPNAGKSSLLNSLTRANVKTAAYPFTTLEPNLGDFYGLIIADIPGLIEGASSGKGLGIKFLRHIKRTRVLIHCLSSESEDLKKDYKIIRSELKKYEPGLIRKKEYVFLTKIDLLTEEELREKMEKLKKINPDVIAVSVYDEDSLEEVKKLISGIKNNKK